MTRRGIQRMVRNTVQQHIDDEDKRETFRQDGIHAWNEYRATGLHATQEDTDAWLGKLETGQDVEPPDLWCLPPKN